MTRTLEHIKPVHTTDAVFPLSVAQYHEMIRLGVLNDDDPVELLEGVLVFHMPKNPPHRYVTRAAFDAISQMLPVDWHCQMQEPITLQDGEPEPDLCIVRGKPADYRAQHPAAGDVAIVMEVSDSTIERDRGVKYRSYARAKIPQYWIIDLAQKCVDVFTQPSADKDQASYERSIRYPVGQSVPIEIEGKRIGNLQTNGLLD